jgi:tetratricopeptide (TPR) repeat protein
LNYCFDEYKESFIDIIKYLSHDCRNFILENLSGSFKISEASFNIYIELGLFSEAEKIYDEISGRESFSSLTSRLNLIKLYIQLKDFASAAKELEQFIEYDIDNSGVFYSKVGYSEYFGPYDAFIQSKEYKAMMARVYTSPGK